jgi:hypothetical protein
MDICGIAAVDKRLLGRKVGADLAKRHGSKPYYAVQDIKAAARRCNFPDRWDCWALSLYASPHDFADYHLRTGERCDYASMHESMADAIAVDAQTAGIAPLDPSHVVDAVDGGSSSHGSSWFDGLAESLTDAHHSDP